MPMQDPVRLKLLKQIQAQLQAVDTATWGMQFTAVKLGPLGDPDFTKRFMCGIVPDKEHNDWLFPYQQNKLDVVIEFRAAINKGDPDPAIIGEQVSGVVKQAILNDKKLNGLAVDTKITNSQVDLDTYLDRGVQGIVLLEILYRTNHENIFSQEPSV